MNNMKLIMEGWRRYSNQPDDLVFILEGKDLVVYDLAHEFRLIQEGQNNDRLNVIFEKWLRQTDKLLQENMVGKFFGQLKDKVGDLPARAKEAAIRFLKNPYMEMSLQLVAFMLKVKNYSFAALAKIAKVGSRINKARLKFKESQPTVYAVATIAVQIAVITAVTYAIQQLSGGGVAMAKVVGLPGSTGGELSVTGEHLEATKLIIGFTNESGHPGLAQELARHVHSPMDVDYLSLKPELQQAINDGLVVMKQATELVQGDDPAVTEATMGVIEKLMASGEGVFQDLMRNFGSAIPRDIATR
jgi:hypothetical protein